MIVLDSSESIGSANWDRYIIDYVERLVETMDIDGRYVRISVVTFSTSDRVNVEFYLRDGDRLSTVRHTLFIRFSVSL